MIFVYLFVDKLNVQLLRLICNVILFCETDQLVFGGYAVSTGKK